MESKVIPSDPLTYLERYDMMVEAIYECIYCGKLMSGELRNCTKNPTGIAHTYEPPDSVLNQYRKMQETNQAARETMERLERDQGIRDQMTGSTRRIADPFLPRELEEVPITVQQAEEAVHTLLGFLGYRPNESLEGTPGRVVRMLLEMTEGERENPASILSRTFSESSDELILLKGIEFTSLCEHHLLPFVGTASVGYIPGTGRVVGLSKLARLVDCFSKRLQIQERMTKQIAKALEECLNPVGVGVIVKARHSCMGCRGVKKSEAEMVTSCMLGAFRTKSEARAEFLALCQ